MKTIYKERFPLNAEGIDELSEQLFSALGSNSSLPKRDLFRIRLSAEDILLYWMEQGKEFSTELLIEEKGQHLEISIHLLGTNEEMDPLNTDEMKGVGIVDNLMATLGIEWGFDFHNGKNSVYISISAKQIHRVRYVAIAFLLAILCSALLRLFPQTVSDTLQAAIFEPLFSYGSRFLTAIVSPMMFLAVIGGVLSVGSPKYLNTMGKYVCGKFLLSTLSVIICAAVVCSLVFSIDIRWNNSLDDLRPFLTFISEIIPDNIVSPFINCNMIQIVFMGVVVGVAMLFLQNQIRTTLHVVEDINVIICKIITGFEQLLPAFIFLSVLNTGLSLHPSTIYRYLKMFGIYIIFLVIIVFLQFVYASWRLKIPVRTIWKKLYKTFLAPLISASSSVAFTEAYDACEKNFGVDSKLVGFALPIGTVIHKPLIAAEFVFFIAAARDINGTPLNIGSLLMLIALAFLVSVAYPPVSGGEISCYTILLMQMGLPAGLLAVACTFSSLLDFLEAPGHALSTEIQILLMAKRREKKS